VVVGRGPPGGGCSGATEVLLLESARVDKSEESNLHLGCQLELIDSLDAPWILGLYTLLW